MDRQKPRKVHENRKFPCDGIDFSTNIRATYNEKSRYKAHHEKKQYNMSTNSCSVNWTPQPISSSRYHPVTQRKYSTSESSVCHYSVPLGFTFEPISLPIYPALIQPQGSCPLPFEIESFINKSKSHKKHKNRLGTRKANSVIQNDPSAIFHTPKLNSGDQQDYASLPPVNCDIYAAKSSDTEAVCKRRFSDPGIGQLSSDDCSSSRSDDTNKSSGTAELQSDEFFTLVEQINELKESNSSIKKELNETKMELEAFKMLSWKTGYEDLKPGVLSDAIIDIRNAVKLSEEALVSKVIQMLEKNSIEFKEAQKKLEEKLKTEVFEKLSKLEEDLNKQGVSDGPSLETSSPLVKEKDSDVQQIAELERENFQLRKELQEAVAKRKIAEAATEKLERLVGILRKKINGVSLESCISDDKHILARPLASSLEKNPFIIANNRQTQKSEPLLFSKARLPAFKGILLDNLEGATFLAENKENENGETVTGNGSSGTNFNHASSEASVTAQVTITGPVTDL